MPELSFSVESRASGAVRGGADSSRSSCGLRMPTRQETIHTVVLRAQIQLEVARRRYAPAEQAQHARTFRRARPLEPDASHHAVDACQRGGAVLHRKHAGGSSGPLHVRFQRRRDEIFPRSGERRHSAAAPVQRDRFLRRIQKSAAGCAHLLGQGNEVSACRWQVWKSMMDLYYPNSVLAFPAKGCFRAPAPVQSRATRHSTWERSIRNDARRSRHRRCCNEARSCRKDRERRAV